MATQTLTIGKRRFVVVPEREFRRLQKRAGEGEVRPEFAKEAMKELHAYRKTGKAVNWTDDKGKPLRTHLEFVPSPGTPGEGQGGGLHRLQNSAPTPALPRSTRGGRKTSNTLTEKLKLGL